MLSELDAYNTHLRKIFSGRNATYEALASELSGLHTHWNKVLNILKVGSTLPRKSSTMRW